jgi:hypothetical protein
MSCAVTRDPAAEPARPAGSGTQAGAATRPDLAPLPRSAPAVSNPHGLAAQAQPAETQLLVEAQ